MPDIQLYRQIVQLQGEIVRISARNSDLKKQCEELETELAGTERRRLHAKGQRVPGQKKPNARRGWILNAWLLKAAQVRRLLRDLPI
jgi:predicted alpha/beta-hydrolase family hydrolase